MAKRERQEAEAGGGPGTPPVRGDRGLFTRKGTRGPPSGRSWRGRG